MSSSAEKSELSSTFTVQANGTVDFRLDVRNNTSRMIELRFPNGRTHDFIVQDASGKQVWRWGATRMFTQGLQNKLVKSHAVASYNEEWDPAGATGKFTATAVLVSHNHPITERVEFELK